MKKPENKEILVALAGNPNSGKTSLFNSIVGTHLKVGNYPGVTIEKTEGALKYGGYKITFVDLPGTYSLSPYSPEEVITRNFIVEEKPDVVLNVVDGTNLERNLYLTTQIMELGANMLIALNMYDEVLQQGTKIDFKQLQKMLGCHIVPTIATRKDGLDKLLEHIVKIYERKIVIAKNKLGYDPQEKDPAVLAESRYAFINGAVKETVEYLDKPLKTLTDWIDAIFINRLLGIPIFLFIMWAIFQLTFKLGEYPMGWVESAIVFLSEFVSGVLPEGWFSSLLVDGIIAGVGGVISFLPSILLLFLGISFLEATGYMARAAFVVDKLMHKIGLHGKSFIPMLTGFGCSVPAFMACRTLKNPADRITTMLIIPFMSCGAKLPVHLLLIGAFFPERLSGNMLFGVYMFGILVALLSAFLLKKFLFKGESEPFVMELPPYRAPTIGYLLIQMWIKAQLYLKKAGTIILLVSIIMWGLTSFPSLPEDYPGEMSQIEYSLAGRAGKFIEPVIKPLGFDWKIGIALVSGVAAKEVVVSTLGTIYALDDADIEDEEATALKDRISSDPVFTLPTVLALLVFILLYVPCLAATAVFHKEAGSWRYTALYFGYSCGVAWLAAFVVQRISSLFF
ncbi:MAG: ferrous iron transport protein B [Candidatus Margulisbacteria bacterium]|jgi:ferrous iron transport protein B|nr:ferrous iron transport protein B [Candidatus Margulisiibacteriota bacterium]